MKKSKISLKNYWKIIGFIALLFLACFEANSTNPVISNFLTNLSAMVNKEAISDIKPEMIIEGNTIHVVWIEQSQGNKLYYCRSTDLGKTWQTPILIADQTDIEGNSNRKLAVDGNNVHIAFFDKNDANNWAKMIYYIRSTDGGSTFEPVKELATVNGGGTYFTSYQIRAANGKVAVVYHGTGAKNGVFVLSSIDGGSTFTDKLITTQSTRLSDFWYDGNQMVVVSEYQFAAGGWNTDCRVYVSVSNDNGSSFATQKIVYTNEAGDEKTARCYHDIHYVPKIAKSGNNIHIIFIGSSVNDEWTTLYARSTDNGQTFEKAKDINNGLIKAYELDLRNETVAAKKDHVYLEYSSKGKVYFLQSADNGNTFSTAKSILPEGYSYVGSTGFPGLLIDPTDASGSTVYIYGNAMFSTKSTDGGNIFSECMVVVPIHENIRLIISDLVIDSNGNKHWISQACWWEGTDDDIFYKFVGPEPEPGTKNKSLFFETVYNGKLDVAIVPSSPSLDFDSALTAEAWVKFDLASIAENSVDISFFAKVNGADNSNWNVPGGFMMGSRKRWGQMIIYSALGTDKGNFSNVELNGPGIGDTLWHHVAFTYDANGGLNNFKTYVDGLLKIQQTVTGKINQGNGLFMIGARQGFFQTSKYQVDNIRLWSRVLTQEELLKNQVKTFTGKEDSLKLFLNFDDTFKDISGNGNDAIPLYWGVLKESDFNPPIPGFDLYTDMNKVTLTNKTENGTSYIWDFGDTKTSIQENPAYNYPKAGEYKIALTARNNNSVTSKLKPVSIAGLDRIEPSSAGNRGFASISVFGGGLTANSVAKLVKNGIVIVADTSVLVKDGELDVTFDLSGQPIGKWDVVITLSNVDYILKEALTIEAGHTSDPYIYVTGRNAVLSNMWQTQTIEVGNNGNADLYNIPLFIAVSNVPGIEIEFINIDIVLDEYSKKLGHGYIKDSIPISFVDVGFFNNADNILKSAVVHSGINSANDISDENDALIFPLLIEKLPQNSSYSIFVRIKSSENYEFVSWVYGVPGGNSLKSTSAKRPDYFGDCMKEAIRSSLVDVSGEVLNLVVTQIPIGCFISAANARNNTYDAIIRGELQVKSLLWDYASAIINCASDLLPPFKAYKAAMNLVGVIMTGYSSMSRYYDCFRLIFSRKRISRVFSFDPNEMIGPSGFGDQHWIQKNNTIPYTILFENKSTATAPAHIVTVTDTLDITTFDLSEFGFGAFGFGDTILSPNGSKLKRFAMDVDLRPTKNLITRVSGNLDTITGIVTWEFLSLNPTNMELEEDPFIGFLPPNNTELAGEGFVSFSVGLKKELGTNAALKNKASIVFDANTPIYTNEYINTLDLDAPQSQVFPLDASIKSNFPVAWAGMDNGSGIRSYSIFVLENDTILSPWVVNTTDITAVFHGKLGSTYKFYSIATDNVSLSEAKPVQYDASTTVTVGVEEFEMVKGKLTVYPNPANKNIKVTLSNAPCGMYFVELVGINGSLNHSQIYDDFEIQNGININVEKYNPGQYILKVVFGNKTVSRKIMVR